MTKVGLVDNTVLPLPVDVVTPVPPFATAIVVPVQVPVVMAPVLAVTTKPLKLVTPVKAPKVNVIAGVVVAVATDPDTPWFVTTDTDVTVPEPELQLPHAGKPPETVKHWLELPIPSFDKVVEAEAYNTSPAVYDVMPTPPLLTGRVPVTSLAAKFTADEDKTPTLLT
ncbi:hypothetical protein HYZ64_03710 [Candidatus Berkelbacteria bacterium]|nr:hypothetical protein [Candidatus Berkelbacteria bacterium]